MCAQNTLPIRCKTVPHRQYFWRRLILHNFVSGAVRHVDRLVWRLNPAAAEFQPSETESQTEPCSSRVYTASRHCHGEHVDGDGTRVNMYQMWRSGASGRRGLTRLHTFPERPKRKASVTDRLWTLLKSEHRFVSSSSFRKCPRASMSVIE